MKKNKALSYKLLDLREILRIIEVNNSNWDRKKKNEIQTKV